MENNDLNFDDYFETSSKPGRQKGSKKAKEKTVSQMNAELVDALRESELGDSKFLKQWLRSKEVSKTRRQLNRLEKEAANNAIAKARDLEARKQKIIATFKSDDFTYLFWALSGGGIYKEVHCRPGLAIGIKEDEAAIVNNFKITVEG